VKAGEYTNEEVAVYNNILIATDGSELTTNAAKHGVGLARSLNAKVTVVTVTLPYHWFPDDPEYGGCICAGATSGGCDGPKRGLRIGEISRRGGRSRSCRRRTPLQSNHRNREG
jgi:hypothetical protein